jgi:hypothetical protein
MVWTLRNGRLINYVSQTCISYNGKNFDLSNCNQTNLTNYTVNLKTQQLFNTDGSENK